MQFIVKKIFGTRNQRELRRLRRTSKAQVRAQIGGRVERSVQLATALSEGADLFLAQRSSLRRVAGMAVESLDALHPAETVESPGPT